MHRTGLFFFGLLLLSCTSNTLILVPAEAKGDVTIWFVNDSQRDLCDLRMTPSTSASSGYTWLSTAETMFPAGEGTGARVHAGTYKVIAKSCDGKFQATNDQVDISGPTIIALGGTAGIKQVALQTH